MDKGTGMIVGEPAGDCTNCVHCTNIHEEITIYGRASCGSCQKYDIEVCECDRCPNYEERKK